MELQDFMNRLTGAKRTGTGWVARCPAHDDKNPSLSISNGNGKILVKCHAGCTTEAVVGAMGLSKRDLFTGNGSGSSKEYKNRTKQNTDFSNKAMEGAEEQRAKVDEEARERAAVIWKNTRHAPDDHPYLVSKGIKPYGAKEYKNDLVVPVIASDDEIISLQFISGDGEKRFLSGGTVAGGFWTIPGDTQRILTEGFATAASISEATGATVRIAFNAGNLEKVAEPGWIIAGDNDAFTHNRYGDPWNPGREKALKAAWQHGCHVAIPEFPKTEKKPTDFNDLHSLEGLSTVKAQINKAISPAEYLLKECETDPGAPYRKEHLAGLKEFRRRNQAGYMALRSKLKRLKIGINELEKAIHDVGMNSNRATDHLSLAREVVAEYRPENIIHTGAFTWHWDDGGVWRVIDDREIKKVIHTKAELVLDNPTKTIVDSVLDLTKTEIYRADHEWDADQTTINCMNGELALIEGEWVLKPHSREHYRTTQIPVAFDRNKSAPRTELFLNEIFEGDPDSDSKQILVCELIGYTLLSSTNFEKFILLIGSGANGKSVLMDLVANLVGLRNVCAVQPSQFENRFQRAHLHNKLMNCVTELAQGAEIHDAQLKSIVSGEITTAEHKHKPPFDFQPYATCWFGSNHMPHTRDFSDALFRRGIIIPFNRVFAEHEQDKRLKGKLEKELSGMLNLALEALAGVIARGYFTQTVSSDDAKKEWRLNADQCAEFAADRCRFSPGFYIESKHLYEDYKRWAEEAGIRKTLNRKNFTQRISRFGAKPGKGTGGTRVLFGVDLADSGK